MKIFNNEIPWKRWTFYIELENKDIIYTRTHNFLQWKMSGKTPNLAENAERMKYKVNLWKMSNEM